MFSFRITDDYFLRQCSIPKKDWTEYFRNKKNESLHLAYDSIFIKQINELFPALIEILAKHAGHILRHEFNIFGLSYTSLKSQIDWHHDFKNNFSWNRKCFYKDIPIPYGRGDIKVPWELSRFKHAIVLGQNYVLTNNEKYPQEFVSQINDWINKNSLFYGVNWRCPMDTAIRVCNWIVAYKLLCNSSSLTDNFMHKFLKSIFEHGYYIFRNLEYSPLLTTNHYLSNIVGLLYIAKTFPEFKESRKWERLATQSLLKEMDKQVNPDGTDFEGSTHYHRLSLELFFYATLIAIQDENDFNGLNFTEIGISVFGQDYIDKLHRMFECVLYALKPTGTMPQIGDNDNGQLHVYHLRETSDMRYLLTLGAIFFKDDHFKITEFGFHEEAFWIFGEKGHQIWERLKNNDIADIKNKFFPNAGWAVIRNNQNYLLVTSGHNGQNGFGGHNHNDKLSFEWMVDGKDIIVDPGTYLYTSNPKSRNLFRSTDFHNTVSIDNSEMNPIPNDPRLLFSLPDRTQAEILLFQEYSSGVTFEGRHFGYSKQRDPVTHTRRIITNKKKFNYLEIHDIFLGEGKHLLKWNFILHPKMIQKLEITSNIEIKWDYRVGQYSPCYGVVVPTKKIVGEYTGKLPLDARLFLNYIPSQNFV